MKIDENTKKIIVISIPVIILLLLWLRNNNALAVAKQPVDNAPINGGLGQAPAYQALGNDYKPQDINVNLNTEAANYLTNKFVPLFGYAGFAVA